MTLQRASPVMVAIALVLMAGPVIAAYAPENVDTSAGVPLPSIPQGQGDKCVEDTDFMRRNHMNLLMHQRDETMHEGVRGEKDSLKECINCHVVNGADGMPVSISSPQHFCRACHDYAAVSIDCFQCHASRPGDGITSGVPGEEMSGVVSQ